MATAVPLSMIGAFAIVRYLGIELEQFSVASLIIALGMVVDNAIVVSDNAVRLIKQGKPKVQAVIEGVQDLAIPILTSTLTTIAAFLPMLTIAGNVGEYVSSLPVVVTATLAVSYLVGVLLGLLVTGWAMGFMAMLGVLSLGGIVINNAIVLVDFIETNVAAGQTLRTAVAAAGNVRMRPIILTTLTTIGGLLPLSLFGGALWAPMTNGMIFGLIVSTVPIEIG